MAYPKYVLRSYPGGAGALQLAGNITNTQLSIVVVGNYFGWPDGSGGPFSISIDSGLPSVEKLLCSSFNAGTGTLSVWTDGVLTGRGYDGSTPVAHVPQPSIPQVRPCWTADDAAEANAAVFGVLGGSPANGELLGFAAGVPAWEPVPFNIQQATVTAVHVGPPRTLDITVGSTPVTGVSILGSYFPLVGDVVWVTVQNGGTTTAADLLIIGSTAATPSGRMYATGGSTLHTSTATPIGVMSAEFVRGGVTFTSGASPTLTAPVTGWYYASTTVAYPSTVASGINETSLFWTSGVTTGVVRSWGATAASGIPTAPGGSDLVALTAGDTLGIQGFQTSGGDVVTVAGAGATWLSIALIV